MIEILHFDAIALAPSDLPPYHAVITDPPYGEHVHANTMSTGTGGAGTRRRDLGFDAADTELRSRAAYLCQAASRWSVVFSDVESTHMWRDQLTAMGLRYVRTVPWVRWSQPQLSGDRPPAGCEMITLAHPKARKRWSGSGGLTHFAYGPERTKNKHPTQKPLDLMLALVSGFSDPGELVLDPFAGSGTTVLAARLLGREAVGVECDPEWARVAGERVRAPLSERDAKRATSWCESTIAEAESVPAPRKPCERRTYERAQRRLADAVTVLTALE